MGTLNWSLEGRVALVAVASRSCTGNSRTRALTLPYNAMTYRMPPHIVAGLGGLDLSCTGIPTESAYWEACCKRTGRDGLPN